MLRVHPWFKLALCALPLLFLWGQLIRQLSIQWNLNPQYAYGWAVPFLCIYLIWNRIQNPESRIQNQRRHLPSAICYLLLCLFALLYAPTRLVQEANPGWSLVSWPLAFSVIGLTLLFIHFSLPSCAFRHPASGPDVASSNFEPRTSHFASGPSSLAHPLAAPCSPLPASPPHPSPTTSHLALRSSHFSIPLLFFLVAVPWPYAIENLIVQGLTRLNTALTIEIIGWLSIPAIQHGNVIELATGSVGIDEACSGIRSLQATLMLSLFFGELYRLSGLRRLLCVLTGFAIAMVCNLGRMLLLTWVAAKKGEQAIAGWHDPAGITILVACFIGVWLFAVRQASPVAVELPIPAPHRGEGPGEVSPVGSVSSPSSSPTTPPTSSLSPLTSHLSSCPSSLPSPLGGEGQGEVSPVGSTSSPPITPPTSPLSPLTSHFSSCPSSLPSPLGGEGQGEVSVVGNSSPPRSVPVSTFRFRHFCSSLAFLRPTRFSLRTYSVVLAAWLLLVEVGVAAWYRHIESGTRTFATWRIAWPEKRGDFRDLPIPSRATEMLRYDQARQAQWAEPDGTRWQVSFFYWKPGQAAGYLAKSHNPLVCMPAAGYGVVSTSLAQEAEIHGLRFPYRIYSFTQGGATVHVLYSRWDDRAAEQSFATEGVSRFNRLRSVWTGRGNHGQRVITMALWSARDALEARELLLHQLQRLLIVESPSGANPPQF